MDGMVNNYKTEQSFLEALAVCGGGLLCAEISR